MSSFSRLKRAVLIATALALAGCASIPVDRGFAESTALVAGRGGPEIIAPQPEIDAQRESAVWLAAPLTVESAQRIALTRNPRLVQQYARLGFAQADVYDAARISNPSFSLAGLDGSAGGTQVALGLAQNFADLLYLSPRKRRAGGELTRTQEQVADELLKLANEVEVSYYRVVGASAVAQLREAVAATGAASAALAERFFDAGNINRLELNREKAAATAARIDAERAAAAVRATRAELNQLMGLLADENHWRVTTQLPVPVTAEDEIADLQKLAQAGRLDLLAARKSVQVLEDVLGITRRYRLLGDIDVGVDYEHETDHSRLLGPALKLALPIFNWGSGRVERAQAELEQTRATARQLEIEVSNHVRLAHARVASERELVERYRTQLIPQREEIVLRATESQNYMLIGQFELLQAKQQEYDAYQGYLQTLADYWIARAALTTAVGARLPSSSQIQADGIQPKTLLTPERNSDDRTEQSAHGGSVDMSGMHMKGEKDMEGMQGIDHSNRSMPTMAPSHSANIHPAPDTKAAVSESMDGRADSPQSVPAISRPTTDMQMH